MEISRVNYNPDQSSRYEDRGAGENKAQQFRSERVEENELDIGQLLGVIWRGKWFIAFCAVIALGIGWYYATRVVVPKYAAESRLLLQVRDQNVVDLESVISGVGKDQASLNTEVEIMQSRGLIEQLVRDLELTEDPEFNRLLREPSPYSSEVLLNRLRQLLGRQVVVRGEPDEQVVMNLTLRAAQNAIAVTAERGTYLFRIRVTTENRAKSKLMANRLAEIYLDDQIRTKFSATEYAVNWLSQRVTELEAELEEKENAIQDINTQSNMISTAALEALNLRVRESRARLQVVEARQARTRERLAALTSMQGTELYATMAAESDDPQLEELASSAESGDSGAQAAFASRVATLISRDQSALAQQQPELDRLQSAHDELVNEMEARTADRAKADNLLREAETTRVLYETFLARLKETSIQIGLQQADSRILSDASSGFRVEPKTNRILTMAFLLGATFAVAILMLRHFMRDGFRTADELEAATGLTVVGQVPKMPIRRRKGLLDYLVRNPTSAASEAVRNIRTSVLLSNVDNPPRVIMSTSSVPGEGKTTLAIAFSHNLSGLGKRVLLIEGDVRRRTFKNYFRQPGGGGLYQVIAGTLSLDEALIQDPELGFDVLMGDNASINAADLFASERFREFMKFVREQYDFVVIDTPPVLVVPDARVLGHYVDAIMYAVHWDRTPKSQVQDGVRQLSSVGLTVNGLVLSQLDPKRMRRYGYGGKYGAYAGYGRRYYNT
ncbi:polysaccharide biosynthesis tyrosine autokinase [Pseudoruegeria sp. HB172150]|uniref:GumC family protein n=1 Tax=Pseudoruegeria sp. HB172150 TaxID=2721164 RepID=UPI001555BF4D|nr:polysaccharide biosynthesis tyrosine autokinase [Pseudoruegeria sp. HB172150]